MDKNEISDKASAYTLSVQEALARFAVDAGTGLSGEQAARRLACALS